MSFQDQAPGVKDKTDSDSPSALLVNKFHNKSDVDTSAQSQHHTIGPKATQAASGKHNHDGRNSPLLLTGFTLTGSRGGNAAVASIVAALVQLGATDGTSA